MTRRRSAGPNRSRILILSVVVLIVVAPIGTVDAHAQRGVSSSDIDGTPDSRSTLNDRDWIFEDLPPANETGACDEREQRSDSGDEETKQERPCHTKKSDSEAFEDSILQTDREVGQAVKKTQDWPEKCHEKHPRNGSVDREKKLNESICKKGPEDGSVTSESVQTGLSALDSLTATQDLRSINLNQTKSGTIDTEDPQNTTFRGYYEPVNFTGNAGQSVDIEMESDGDTYLFLLGPNGSIIGEDDDGGSGLNSRLRLTLPETGTYTIIATSFDSSATFEYTLSVEETELLDLRTLSVGGAGFSTIDDGDPQNSTVGGHYEPINFDGSAGEELSLLMSTENAEAVLLLIAPNGSLISESRNWESARIEATLPVRGNYTLFAGTDDGTVIDYTVSILPDTHHDVQSITAGESIESTVATDDARAARYEGYHESISFNGSDGQDLTVSLRTGDHYASIYLVAPNGTILAVSDDWNDVKLHAELPVTGTYRFVIGSPDWSVSTFDYQFSVTGATHGDTQRIAINDSVLSTVDTGDHYSSKFDGYHESLNFTGQTRQELSLTISASDVGVSMSLLAPNGTVIAKRNDWETARLHAVLPTDGTYTIVAARQWGSETFDYQLSLVETGHADLRSISLNQTDVGAIDTGDPHSSTFRGYYEPVNFSGAAGQFVSIDMRSRGDTYLYLVSPNGSIIDQDDDGGSGLNSALDLTLPTTGTYTIIATSYDSRATFGYSLALTGPIQRDIRSIELNQTKPGSIEATDPNNTAFHGDYEPINFSGKAGQAVELEMRADGDTYLILVAPNGTVIRENDDGGFRDNSRIRQTLPTNGTHTIVATTDSSDDHLNYTLSTESITPRHLSSISVNQTLQGRLGVGDPRASRFDGRYEPVEFAGTAGQQLSVTIHPTSPEDQYIDSYLYLVAPNGSIIGEDDHGVDDGSRIETTLPTTGTYTAIVTGDWETNSFDYEISVEPSTHSDNPSIRIGGAFVSTLDTGDPRSARFGEYQETANFSGRAGQEISLGRTSRRADIDLYLLAPNGTILQVHESWFDSPAQIQLPENGTYTVVGTSDYPHFGTGRYGVSLLPAEHRDIRTIGLNEGALGTVDSGDPSDIDFDGHYEPITLQGQAGDEVRIHVRHPQSFVDTYLYLIAPNGSIIAQNDYGGEGSLIERALPVTGNYTVVVTGDWQQTFDYRLEVVSLGSESVTANLTGRIVRPNGQPAADDFVYVGGESPYVGTNQSGWFEATVRNDATHQLGYYQGNFSTNELLTGLRDRSPDLYTLGEVAIGPNESKVRLGNLTLPTGYPLNVTVVNESSMPVEDARVRIVHNETFGTGTHPTNANGRLVLRDASHPGTELHGPILIEVKPPTNDTRFLEQTQLRNLTVTSETNVTVKLEERAGGPGTLIVNKSDPTAYDSIQTAVENATDGDQVEVHPGTYRETLRVETNISLVAPDGATLNGSSENLYTGIVVGGYTTSNVEVRIRGVTITDYYIGVWTPVSAALWTLRNATVKDNNFGIYAAGHAGTARIQNTSIQNNSHTAVYLNNATGNWSIEDSSIIHNGLDGVNAFGADGRWSVGNSTIVGNARTGVVARGTTNGTVAYNWWGAASGPNGSYTGNGQTLVGSAPVKPFYADGAMTQLASNVSPRNRTTSVTLLVDANASGYDTIQAAIDRSLPGDTIEVRNETYRQPIRADLNVTITAPNGASLNVTDGDTFRYAISVPLASHVEPTVDGFTVTDTDGGVGAYLTHGDWRVVNLTTTPSTYVGVSAWRSSGDWVVKRASISGSRYGIVMGDSAGDWKISETTIRNTSSMAIYASWSAGDWKVRGSRILNASGIAINAKQTSGNWSIRSTVIENISTTGSSWMEHDGTGVVAVDSSGHWSIHNSTIRQTAKVGLNATGASPASNATYNYWGATDGPSGDFNGSGDAVFGNVTIRPYYIDANLTELSSEQGASGERTPIIDGFESVAYNDSNPVKWRVESPGQYIRVQNTTVKRGDHALVMRSGENDNNKAILTHKAEGRTIEDGDVFSLWMRTDGRVFYAIGTENGTTGGAHSIKAGVSTDHDNLQIRTHNENGTQIDQFKFGSADAGTWYYFEMEMYPSRAELVGRFYNSSMHLLGEDTVNTSGATNLEYTTLLVPTPFGRQDTGWYDNVSIGNWTGTAEAGTPTVTLEPVDTPVNAEQSANLTLTAAPEGLSGYNLSVSISNGTVANFTGASYPSFGLESTSIQNGNDTIGLKVTDLNGIIEPGETNATLATLAIRGTAPGKTNLSITIQRLDDDSGNIVNATVEPASIQVKSCAPLAPDLPAPTDPDGDGDFEDTNGNGRFDFDDIVTLFEELSNAQPGCMDFNNNGRMDFDDIVTLFEEI